ncbi:MAG: DUF554 family protein [Peptococcaceae bacterium]
MAGMGTIINVGAIIIGGILGLLFGNLLQKRYQEILMTAVAVCVLFIGIGGDYSILAAKAVLDLIIILILTATMGKGCVFSAVPVALFQGSITILARMIEPLMTAAALSNLSLVGSIMIFCVGANLLWDLKIRVANMLPVLVIAVIWAFL